MINDANLSKAFVQAALYPPLGIRSYGPFRQSMTLPNHSTTESNNNIITLAMIETTTAYENLDSILETPHLTGVFIGPADLSVSMGYPPSSSPRGPVLERILEICARAHEREKIAGIFCADTETAIRMKKAQFDFISVGIDTCLLANAGKQAVEEVRKE
eukprot:TRINITY_DN1031_c0_g1_i3.p1 TRINITY_DN1031_c0_g1~~TRINITY_DN1031_c0_g1_i3.p1  ORF type:complete len:159 (+),score=31.45 TRINITY_DN1031_c0_g1_i3:443-919(+)